MLHGNDNGGAPATGGAGDTRWLAAARAELRRLQAWLERLAVEQQALRQRDSERALTADEERRLEDLAREVETVRALLGRAAARLPTRGSS